MTLVTLSNLNAEDFSFHNIAINRTWQLVGTEMTEASWGKELSFWRPRERKLRVGIKIFTYRQGEPTPLHNMEAVIKYDY